MGFPICGGGRYDKMMQAFGKSCPATGFAVGIDRIMLVLARQQKLETKTEWDYFIAWSYGKLAQAIAKSVELRKMGKTVKVATTAFTRTVAENERKANDCKELIFIE